MANVRFKKSSILTERDRQKRQQEEFRNQSLNITPCVYAGIALALSRYWNWTLEDIAALFQQSEDIWGDLDADSMIEMCERETGIRIQRE